MTKLASPSSTIVTLPLKIDYDSQRGLTLDISCGCGSTPIYEPNNSTAFVEIHNHENVSPEELISRLNRQLSLNGYLENVGVNGEFEDLIIEIGRTTYYVVELRLKIKPVKVEEKKASGLEKEVDLKDRFFPGFTLAESNEEITPEKELERLARYMGRTLMAPFREYRIPATISKDTKVAEYLKKYLKEYGETNKEQATLADLWDVEANCRSSSLRKYLDMFRETARNLSLTYTTESTDETRILSASKFVNYSLRRMIRLAERIENGEFSDWKIPVTEKPESSVVGRLAKVFRIV